METHIERTMCGELCREYNVWSFVFRVQWKETHIDGKMHGDSYKVYNVRRLI